MRNYRQAQTESVRHPLLIMGFWLVAVMVSVSILYLTAVPLAEAVFYKGKTFSVNSALDERSYYEGKDFEMVVILKNSSPDLQLVTFTGACQATFSIYDLNGNKVYPLSADEFPCNNTGYERFLIYSTQEKLYNFVLKGKVLKPGKYKAVGFVDGFGTSDPIKFEVVEKPNFYAQEGDLCEGATGRICDFEAGLSCQHIGGFPFGAGLCMPRYTNFIPQDRCSNKFENCFDDLDGHPYEDVITSYANRDKLEIFGRGNFRPDDPIEVDVFAKFVSDISQKNICIKTEDQYLQRDTALEVLYKAFIENKEASNKSLSCPFLDISSNSKKDYIIASYKLNLLEDNNRHVYRPLDHLSRGEAVVLVDRFEKL